MAAINYNDSAFRALFPAYANIVQYPSSQIQIYWNSATTYISNTYGGYYAAMNVAQQTQALNLMTAHLTFLNNQSTAGQTPGVLTAAAIDKINVTLQPPPEKNQWQWWLNQSPYGQQLLALLQVASVGGFYASSAVPGRAGFWFGNGM